MILLLLAGQVSAQVPVIDTICPGAVRYYGVVGEEGSYYAWTLMMPDSTVLTLPSDADTVEIAWEYSPGIYELRVVQYPTNGCEGEMVLGNVWVVDPPDVFSGADGEICETGSYHLVNATAEFTSSVLWITYGDGSFDNPAWLNPTYTPGPGDIATGQATLALIGYGLGLDGTCDPDTSAFHLSIEDEIVPEFVKIGPLCQYSIPPSLPDTSVNSIPGTWEPDTINTEDLGWHYYHFTPDSGSCAVDTTIGIKVVPLPEVFAGTDQTIPVYSSTQIDDATASGTWPLSFSWSPGSLLLDSTVLWPWTLDLDQTTTFTLTVTDSAGCTASDEVTIFVQGSPLVIDPTAYPDTLCLGDQPVQLYANVGGGSGAYTFLWTSNPPGFTSTLENPQAEPLQTTTYILTVDDGVMVITDSVTVTVHPLPAVDAGPNQIILPGTSTVLSDATASGVEPLSYLWTPSGQLIDPTELNPTTVDLDVTTVFTLTVTDSNGCVNSDEMTVFVSEDALVVDPYADPEAICIYNPVQLFANASGGSGAYTFLWTSDPPGFSSTEENPVVAPEVTTEYTVEVHDGFDSVSGSVTVTVHPLPEVFAGEDQTIPSGSATVIGDATATGTAPLTYSWEPAEWLEDPTVLNPTTLALYTTTTFTLTVTDSNTCDASDEMTIFVESIPLTVVASIDKEAVCLGDSAQLSAIAAGGTGTYTYSWTSEPPGFTSTEQEPMVSPLVTTLYIVEADDGDTTAMDSVMLIVNDPPEVYAGADQTIPIGSSTTISDATATGTQPLAYSWSPDAFLVDPTVLNPTTVDLFATTILTLTVVDSNGCFSSDTMTIYVEESNLAVDPTVEPEEICLGETAQLTANASGGSGAYIYSWTSNPPGFTSNKANPVVSPVVTTTYIVEVYDGTDTVVDSVTLIVNDPPEVFAGEDQFIPLGTSTVIADATVSGVGPFTYTWEPADKLVDPNVLNPVTVALFENTTFTLTVEDGNTCSSSDTVTIYVSLDPLVADPYVEPSEICLGDSAQLFAGAEGGMGTYTYSWTSDPAGFTSSEENPWVSPPVTTTYTVEVSDGYTTTLGSVTLIVHDPPTVYAGADQVILSGSSTVIDDAYAIGTEPMTYSWIPATLLLDPNVLNPATVELEATTTFTLTVTDANGCSDSDEMTVEVGEWDSLQAITGPDSLCLGETANVPVKVNRFIDVANFQLKLNYNVDKLYCQSYVYPHPQLEEHLEPYIDTANGVIMFEWHSDVPVTLDGIQVVAELVFETKEAGQGELDWYTSASDSYFTNLHGDLLPVEFFAGQVIVYNPPEIFLEPAMPVCVGEPVSLAGVAYGTNAPLTYRWTYPNGDTTSTDIFIDSVTMADAGNYVLTVTDAVGCTDQKSITLQVYPNPVALFHGTDSIEVQPGYVLEAGEGLASYLWNTGETTDKITIYYEGQYIVEMLSEADCYGIDSIYIEIIEKCFDVPNAFTPNSDGLNDYFEAITVCPIADFRMLIYNRWGEKLFESRDISRGWDGRKDGVDCPGDSYVFVITYKVQREPGVFEENVKTGVVILLR